MNSRFNKYLKLLQSDEATESTKSKALAELHKTFAMLTQEEQKYATRFLHEVERGEVAVEADKSLRDYITEYQEHAKDDQIRRFANSIGIDESKLRDFMKLYVTDEFGKFDTLKASINREDAKVYFEKLAGVAIPLRKINTKIDSILRKFLLAGGFDI